MTAPTDTHDDTEVELVEALYAALVSRDVDGLVELLAEDFEGHLTAGLPDSIGGAKVGRRAMLQAWADIAAVYDVVAVPHSFARTDDGRFLVTGVYDGVVLLTEHPFQAEFAHLITVEGGRLRRLDQYTDSARWREALIAM